MRGLIIDYARSRQAQKRGGLFEITSLGPSAEHVIDDREIARIGDAVDELAKVDRELADVVDLRFFCGFSFRRDCRDARRLGTDGRAALGEGPDLSAPHNRVRLTDRDAPATARHRRQPACFARLGIVRPERPCELFGGQLQCRTGLASLPTARSARPSMGVGAADAS
jgi:hypothetical protein